MDNPAITWYAKMGDSQFQSENSFYAGTYTKDNNLQVDIQIWNNRWGVEDVQDLPNAVLNFYFDTLEDSALLKNCNIIINEMDQLPVVVKGQKASVVLTQTLSGRRNNGDDTNADNKNNFVSLSFVFNAKDYRLKDNDLKNLYFEVISLE